MRLSSLALALTILGTCGNLAAAGKRSAARPKSTKAAAQKAAQTFHKVRKGETAAKIAKHYKVSLDDLETLNPRLDLDHLALGTQLRVAGKPIPAKATVQPRTRKTGTPLAALPGLPELQAPGLAHLERMLPTAPRDPLALPPQASLEETSTTQALAAQIQPVLASDPNAAPAPSTPFPLGFELADPANLDLLWPVETRTKSSLFGQMRTRTRVKIVKVKGKGKSAKKSRRVKVPYRKSHQGIDLNAPIGTDIYAAHDGRVVRVGWDKKGYGNFIVIDHGNGVETLYGHNSRNFVHEGDIVHRGQKIALVGSTGRSTGPHCHFELILGGQKRNPEPFLNEVEEIPEEIVAQNKTIDPASTKR